VNHINTQKGSIVSEPASATRTRRTPLTRERVLQQAVAIADADGLAALTIRALASGLDVKPMAIYHHVANKEEILDGIVDLVFSEIELPGPDEDWQAGMRRRARSARTVMARHTWAIALMETRTSPGPSTLRHHDAVIGALRAAGFPIPMVAHAFALLDAFIYGFALQEATLPMDGPEDVAEIAGPMLERMSATDYPHLVEFAAEHVMKPGYDFGKEFDFGLELILSGLARENMSA
jgi:AcrR family transcriptional regulator